MFRPFNSEGGFSSASIHSSVTWDDEVQSLFLDVGEEHNLAGAQVTTLTPDPMQNPALLERFSQLLPLTLVIPSIHYAVHLSP